MKLRRLWSHVPEIAACAAAAMLPVSGLVGCAALEAFLGAAAPVAGQVAASSLAAAVADARARGQLPTDGATDRLEARLAALEAAERRPAGCPAVDAGAPLTAGDVAELLDREATARAAAAEERRALAGELRALLAAPRPAPALLLDAGAEGGT